MTATKSSSLSAGLLVALMGVVPIAVMLLRTDATGIDSTTTTAGRPPTTIVEVAPPEIEGVDPQVGRVLYAYGAADAVAPGTSGELPDSVVKVLGYYDVTLTVPMGEQP